VLAALGYTSEQAAAIPEGANLGLGCGNPLAHAELVAGETVLDLGSGAGIDCFIAARQVGPAGRAIGVDMTPAMIDRARANARRASVTNVEFRLGEIEHLPVADGSVDAIVSNCVVNLSPDKPAVFREAWRVLRAGGRLLVSDLVWTKDVPDALKARVDRSVGCVAGASRLEDYLALLSAAGFRDVAVVERAGYAPAESALGDDAEERACSGPRRSQWRSRHRPSLPRVPGRRSVRRARAPSARRSSPPQRSATLGAACSCTCRPRTIGPRRATGVIRSSCSCTADPARTRISKRRDTSAHCSIG